MLLLLQAASGELARLEASRASVVHRVASLEGQLGRLVDEEATLLEQRAEGEQILLLMCCKLGFFIVLLWFVMLTTVPWMLRRQCCCSSTLNVGMDCDPAVLSVLAAGIEP
jgi:hypothetical protein